MRLYVEHTWDLLYAFSTCSTKYHEYAKQLHQCQPRINKPQGYFIWVVPRKFTQKGGDPKNLPKQLVDTPAIP
jgi:hypothetical protein